MANQGISVSEAIKESISYFQSLFNAPHQSDFDINYFPPGIVIDSDYTFNLTAPFSDSEIKKVVFKGSSNSTPGPDGFNFEFYKSTWVLIGTSVCNAIKGFFHNAYIPRTIKATAITLIPKSTNAESIGDFRPIALCNTLYKIIAKLLAERMKPIMPKIIKENQAGFIKKRISTDNVILDNEILQFSRKSSNIRLMCVKYDIKKAFDSVSRHFLLARMKQKGFPNSFIKWIEACILDVWFSLCMDGSLEGFFQSSSGLRQGCPLSPYLFSIVMDGLSCLLDSNLLEQYFEGFSFGNFRLTHLLYADDLIIFGKAEVDNCIKLSNILKEFSRATGLHVNFGKSSVILPPNCINSEDLCSALNIPAASSFMTYLGIPLSPFHPKISCFSKLMESIIKKLSGWKAKALSFAGILQFLRYTIWNTIAYWIRGSIIPKTILKQIDRLCAKFLFFGDLNKKKLHLISWKKTCKPKEFGGIGLPSLQSLQFCFNCSLILRIYNEKSPLSSWLLHLHVSPWKDPLSKASKYWKNICRDANLAKAKFHFIVSVNSNAALFWDHWVKDSCIKEIDVLQPLLSVFPVNERINVIMNGYAWVLPEHLPLAVRDYLSHIPIFSADRDTIYWDDVKACWHKNFRDYFHIHDVNVNWWEFVWHKHYILRYSSYSWMALSGGLKTADSLLARNISVDPICALCHSHAESINHLFFECDYSFTILSKLISNLGFLLLRPSVLQIFEYIKETRDKNKDFYYLLICSSIYYIWRERNDRNFGNSALSSTSLSLKIKSAVFSRILKWKNSDMLMKLL
ncbi:hypothetical protein KFK09_023031 [Dendrobium nobile]|uniref:Reverse transcriptase domain-containing protein n=1 Tax=Dendrobium nobile TaxID=94219 RepID=A0A8T3AKB6_DENNO|nr:hypothetical protein KFK09_023031 [Dendrobium nobile]